MLLYWRYLSILSQQDNYGNSNIKEPVVVQVVGEGPVAAFKQATQNVHCQRSFPVVESRGTPSISVSRGPVLGTPGLESYVPSSPRKPLLLHGTS